MSKLGVHESGHKSDLQWGFLPVFGLNPTEEPFVSLWFSDGGHAVAVRKETSKVAASKRKRQQTFIKLQNNFVVLIVSYF